MPEFETIECANCGDEFRALPGANAAENGYCSPDCEVSGKEL